MFEMTRVKKDYTELILCECGCGFTLAKYDKYGIERKFINGHANRGKIKSEETKKKMSEARKGIKPLPKSYQKLIELNKLKTGENNHMWKGDDVKYKGLHHWIRKYLPKPEDRLCVLCHLKPIEEVACITSIYNREFKNWAWFCASCNSKWDNVGVRRRIKRKFTSLLKT